MGMKSGLDNKVAGCLCNIDEFFFNPHSTPLRKKKERSCCFLLKTTNCNEAGGWNESMRTKVIHF